MTELSRRHWHPGGACPPAGVARNGNPPGPVDSVGSLGGATPRHVLTNPSISEGIKGLLDDKRGRRGPLKVTPAILDFVRAEPDLSGAKLAAAVAERFGVALHRRTLERLRPR